MKKNLKYVYYRHPRTTAEARANQEGWERPCRRLHNLPNAYDDIYPRGGKSWKTKRKTQYYPNGRGKEHSVIVDAEFTYEWDLEQYFKEHNIPYRVEHIRKSCMRKFDNWKRVPIGIRPVWITTRHKKDGKTIWGMKLSHYTEKFEWVRDGYKWKNVTYTTAYKVTWWSNKDIGIDYVLNCCRRKRSCYI